MSDPYDPHGAGYIVRRPSLHPNQLVYGKTGSLLCSETGELLFTDSILSPRDLTRHYGSIEVWWDSGKDVDICAYTSMTINGSIMHTSGKLGYSYSSSTSITSVFDMKWLGDDTTGCGTEVLTFDARIYQPSDGVRFVFKIHLNYFGEASSEETKVTAHGTTGDVIKYCVPAANQEEPATTSDPYVTFTYDPSNGSFS